MEESKHQAYTTPRQDIFDLVPTEAMTVLDVGCSNGELGASLARARVGRNVFGIEGDPVFCEVAATRLSGVVCADLDHFDWWSAFPGRQFDCIIFADVLEHLREPWQCLQSAVGRLATGGAVVVSVPNIRHVSALFSIFVRGAFPRNPRGLFDRTHLRWFTLRDATAMLEGAGLSVQKYDYSLRLGDRGDGLANKALRRLATPVQHFAPVHEFFAYQVCLQAVKTA